MSWISAALFFLRPVLPTSCSSYVLVFLRPGLPTFWSSYVLVFISISGIWFRSKNCSLHGEPLDPTLSTQRADERRRSAQHVGVRSIGWLGSAPPTPSSLFSARWLNYPPLFIPPCHCYGLGRERQGLNQGAIECERTPLLLDQGFQAALRSWSKGFRADNHYY